MTHVRAIWQQNMLIFAHFRKTSVVVWRKKILDRGNCKRYYFPYYCVPVRYRTKVTVDSSVPPINIPKNPKYIFF